MLVVPVVALPDLSVIVAEILTVLFSAKPLISSKSVYPAVPEAAIVTVTVSAKSVLCMVCAAPRFAKFPVVLPKICTVPPSRDASFATGTFTCICVLALFQYPVLTFSVTVVTEPTGKPVGTIPSTTIDGLESTKLLLAGIVKTVIGLPALSRMVAPGAKAMVVTSNWADASPASTK